jgi:hypothetical protein
MRHGIPRRRHKWNQTTDQKLLDAVKKYGNNNWNIGENFTYVSIYFPLILLDQSQGLYQKMSRLLNVKSDTLAWIQHSNGESGRMRKILVSSQPLKLMEILGWKLLLVFLVAQTSSAGNAGPKCRALEVHGCRKKRNICWKPLVL